MRKSRLIACFGALLVSGCAAVQYDAYKGDQKTANNIGIPFYAAKPFLLVEYGVNEKGARTVKTSVVSLPDRTTTYRARVRNGIGTANLQLALSHGILTSTNGTTTNTDSLSGVLTALGGAAAVPANIALTQAQAQAAIAAIGANAEGINASSVQSFVEESMVAFGAEAPPANCQANKLTGGWASTAEGAVTDLGTLTPRGQVSAEGFTALRNTIVADLMNWETGICTSPALNYRGSVGPVEIRDFQEAAAKFRGTLTGIIDNMSRLQGLHGCPDQGDRDCRTLNAVKAELDRVQSDIGKYVAPQLTVRNELWEIRYDTDGRFLGFGDRPVIVFE